MIRMQINVSYIVKLMMKYSNDILYNEVKEGNYKALPTCHLSVGQYQFHVTVRVTLL